VRVDESFPREPSFGYGQNKLLCEEIFCRANDAGKFKTTIVRPSNTYGPGHALIDQMEFDSCVWDRVERGLPVLCAGDGLGLWVSTHRDDCGKLFAHAALNPRTYGEDYNATHDRIFTWRDYYREAAAALGKKAELVFVPASWVIAQDPRRFGFLRDITQFHGAYSSAKAKSHVPEFRATIEFTQGARETLADVRRRNAWRDSSTDTDYQALVDKALSLGFRVETA
jgi:nucleoside-diphosphate-sugar epimerase